MIHDFMDALASGCGPRGALIPSNLRYSRTSDAEEPGQPAEAGESGSRLPLIVVVAAYLLI